MAIYWSVQSNIEIFYFDNKEEAYALYNAHKTYKAPVYHRVSNNDTIAWYEAMVDKTRYKRSRK